MTPKARSRMAFSWPSLGVLAFGTQPSCCRETGQNHGETVYRCSHHRPVKEPVTTNTNHQTNEEMNLELIPVQAFKLTPWCRCCHVEQKFTSPLSPSFCPFPPTLGSSSLNLVLYHSMLTAFQKLLPSLLPSTPLKLPNMYLIAGPKIILACHFSTENYSRAPHKQRLKLCRNLSLTSCRHLLSRRNS